MKKITHLLPLFALALMVGCAKDTDLSNPAGPDDVTKGAYVSLRIADPASRADLPEQDGTLEESSVSAVELIVFDKEYNFVGLAKSNAPVKANVFDLEVSPDAYRFFAVANPTPAMSAALAKASGNWNTVEATIQTVLALAEQSDLEAYSQDGAFPMTNAGSFYNNVETVLVHPATEDLGPNGKLSTVASAPTPISIKVDRLVAKFSAKVSDPLDVQDERTIAGDTESHPVGIIEGVRLNVTNKKSYIYSHIKMVNATNDDYRADPNMSVANSPAKPKDEVTPLTENFFWLHNYESPQFNEPTLDGSTEYVFENTAIGGEFYNYNNLTQLVVKATYIPTGQPDPANLPTGYTTRLTHKPEDKGTWFAIDIVDFGTMQMTFAGLLDYYEANSTGSESFVQDLETCKKMDIQLRHMLAQAADLEALAGVDLSTVTWAHPDLTCTILNSIPNGGYVAATVEDEENYIVQFYQFGLNYYDIFVQHDSGEEIGHLGRWGMVRNNHYTLSINSITGPGLPYIPDPTDPEIKDPKNPDPESPEPADKGMAYIQATIAVNPWTMWTQGVDLN